MKEHVRAAVAYLGGRLVSKRERSGIWDCFRQRAIPFRGSVTANSVDLYDYSTMSYLKGTGDGKEFWLYHYGQKNYVSLEINGMTFRGFDHASKRRYQAIMNGPLIALYDFEKQAYSNYFF